MQHSRDLLNSPVRLRYRDARLPLTKEACICTRPDRPVARTRTRRLSKPISRVAAIRSGSSSDQVESPGSRIRGFFNFRLFAILLNLVPVVREESGHRLDRYDPWVKVKKAEENWR
jgi:hypothetical protein